MSVKKRDKYARHKLASIPILLCVLAYVLFGQSQENEMAFVVSPNLAPNLAPNTGRVPPNSSSPVQTEPTIAWPEVTLDFLDQPNPLANYMHAPSSGQRQSSTSTSVNVDPSITTIDPVLNVARDLHDNQVKYVFRSDHRQLVMLGQQIYEKGQELTDGVQLTDIQDDALILSNSKPTNSPSQSNNSID